MVWSDLTCCAMHRVLSIFYDGAIFPTLLALTLLLAGRLTPAFREAASKRPGETGLPPSLAPDPDGSALSRKTVRHKSTCASRDSVPVCPFFALDMCDELFRDKYP